MVEAIHILSTVGNHTFGNHLAANQNSGLNTLVQRCIIKSSLFYLLLFIRTLFPYLLSPSFYLLSEGSVRGGRRQILGRVSELLHGRGPDGTLYAQRQGFGGLFGGTILRHLQVKHAATMAK